MDPVSEEQTEKISSDVIQIETDLRELYKFSISPIFEENKRLEAYTTQAEQKAVDLIGKLELLEKKVGKNNKLHKKQASYLPKNGIYEKPQVFKLNQEQEKRSTNSQINSFVCENMLCQIPQSQLSQSQVKQLAGFNGIAETREIINQTNQLISLKFKSHCKSLDLLQESAIAEIEYVSDFIIARKESRANRLRQFRNSIQKIATKVSKVIENESQSQERSMANILAKIECLYNSMVLLERQKGKGKMKKKPTEQNSQVSLQQVESQLHVVPFQLNTQSQNIVNKHPNNQVPANQNQTL